VLPVVPQINQICLDEPSHKALVAFVPEALNKPKHLLPHVTVLLLSTVLMGHITLRLESEVLNLIPQGDWDS
jgi:hypothetical protein